jgi:UDP-3-O-[3-hydroxymyristoyl] N-acetylglucosamine deacetylase
MPFSGRIFQEQISPARTFGFLKEVEQLRRRGYALGGSLENAIVVDDFRVLNKGGLRFPDEFVRHKVLDLIGDLYLLGHPVLGHLVAYKSGHSLNHRLVREILSRKEAWEMIAFSKKEVSQASQFVIPAFAPLSGVPA